MVSCVPYFLNLPLAKAAIAARAHYVDLGGNTDIVKDEIALHPLAVKAGVSVLPDNGLGPGMISTLAVHAISMLDRVDEVLSRDGGLPQKPVPPMNYMLTFSEHGLINEYAAPATALHDGKLVRLPRPVRNRDHRPARPARTLRGRARGRRPLHHGRDLRGQGEDDGQQAHPLSRACGRDQRHVRHGLFDEAPIEVRKGVKVAPARDRRQTVPASLSPARGRGYGRHPQHRARREGRTGPPRSCTASWTTATRRTA